MAEPSTVFPLSSNVNTFHIAIESSSHQNSSSSKKTRGRPHGQSFTGIVGGKVIAADDVNVVAIIFNNHENYKVDTNDSGEEPSYMSSTC
ncbi:hypothetical protein VNO78_18289 [Psophocarpus tetragonolobus]|uniref:Uncharacterized protein n=1 Tax=Psophocarpus tetragonolobus TaxID=3891 RepID=A0AAN9XLD0_PSOTE